MIAQPRLQFFEPHSAGFIQPDEERESLRVVKLQAKSIYTQERRSHRHGDSLIDVDERMILGDSPKVPLLPG